MLHGATAELTFREISTPNELVLPFGKLCRFLGKIHVHFDCILDKNLEG